MSYEDFTKRVDTVISAETGGMGREHFADAPWRDLYDCTGGNASNQQIIDTLEQADTLFKATQDAKRGKPVMATMEDFINGEIDAYARGRNALTFGGDSS